MMKRSTPFVLLCLLNILFFSSCLDNIETKEAIVIGGGLMGSTTAYQLAKEGNEVFLFEKQDSIYTEGSSKGQARIARSSNRNNDLWSYLHNTTIQEIQSLIKGIKSIDPSIKLSMEDFYTTQAVSYLGRDKIYEKLMGSIERQNVDSKVITDPVEALDEFGIYLPDSVLIQKEYNQYSGTINPEAVIQWCQYATNKLGGTVKYKHRINEVTKQGEYYVVRGQDDNMLPFVFKTQKLIVAAGPYTGGLLSQIAPYIKDLVKPQRVFLSFYKPDEGYYNNLDTVGKQKLLDGFPVINSAAGTKDGSFFSMVEYFEDDLPVIKIGGHFQRSGAGNLDRVWSYGLSPEEKSWSSNNLENYLDVLGLPVGKKRLKWTHGYSCVYSLTETEVPIVSNLINKGENLDSQCVVLAGMSGVGAKGCMAYGLIASNLLLDKTDPDAKYQNAIEQIGPKRLKEAIDALSND